MIYFDHHAASPPAEVAMRAMHEAEAVAWANPSSVHAAGRASRARLDEARRQVASAIGAEANDVVFTSGGTESVHLAMHGLVPSERPRHVVSTSIEHPAVNAILDGWAKLGTAVTRLAAPRGVAPTREELRNALRDDTDLVVTQWVNHETGTLLPIADYSLACLDAAVPFVVDATQAFGKVPIAASALGASALIVAGHKMGGPSGIGAVILKRGVDLRPVVLGGAQERGRRAGTPDVVRAIGFGAACTAVPARLAAMPAVAELRDRLEAGLVAMGGTVNGLDGERVATVANLSIQKKQGSLIVAAMDVEGVCISSGAACSSGVSAASPVLGAMYPGETFRAQSAIRLSLAPSNTQADVDEALAKFALVLPRIANLE